MHQLAMDSLTEILKRNDKQKETTLSRFIKYVFELSAS